VGKWEIGVGFFATRIRACRDARRSQSALGTGAPNRLLASRDRRGSAGCFIELQNVPGSFGSHRCEPIFCPDPILAVGGI
jgi:hypothetical protein